MVSAAKFGKAEKELKPARAYGEGQKGNTYILLCMSASISRNQRIGSKPSYITGF